MWARPEKPVFIHPSQLRVGIFVWLDLGWKDHPFLYNKFRISTQLELDQINALGLERVAYYPNKSTAEPGTKAEPATVVITPNAKETTLQPARTSEAVAVRDTLRQQQKDAAARADRGWERAAKQVREALLNLSQRPRQAGENLAELSRDTAKMISSGNEILLHLLGDKTGEGPQFHALNVMTLSVILGKAIGLTETELADLAMGSVAHDCGKAKIPLHILKAKSRLKHEEDFYRSHCNYGVEFAKESRAFSAEALAIVRDHHEFLDKSGFPDGRSSTTRLTGIVALVNRYDRLCCPESPDKPAMIPSEALAFIYTKEKNRFDAKLLGMLIRILGIFPPGTIVQLSDGSLGLIVSPGKESLRPKVLVYDADVAKDDAPVVDLSVTPALKIDESVRPDSLPADVLVWLNPRQRLSYFFSVESAND